MNTDRIAMANQIFLTALLKGDVKPIVEAANELFDAPVDVVDSAGRCICQVPNKYIGENFWDTYINKKSLSLEEHQKAQVFYNSNKTPDKNIVYITDKNLAGTPYLMGQFYDNDIISGHFGILIWNRIPDETDFEIAELFSKILSSIYSNKINYMFNNPIHYDYILHILKNEPFNKAYADSNQKISTLLKPGFMVMVSPINETYTNTSFSHCVCDFVSKNYKDVYSVIYEDNIVTLCCGLSKSSISKTNSSYILDDVLNYLGSYNYITGISNEFSNIGDIKAYFTQALTTVNIGMRINSEQGTHFYDDYTPYQMFLPISELSSPQIFLHPIVLELQSYDDKYKTEYLKTFREYTLSIKDKRLTSENLNIHINTLNYRLDKMKDLFNISEISNQEYLHIICSFLLTDLK